MFRKAANIFVLIFALQIAAACKEGAVFSEGEATPAEALSAEATFDGVPPIRLALAPAKQTLAVGEHVFFSVVGLYGKGKSQIITRNVGFSSRSADVLTIESTGHGVALKEGTTTVTAAYLGVTATSDITVTAARIAQLLIFPSNMTIELKRLKGSPVPQTIELKAYGLRSDAQLVEVTKDVVWSVQDGCGLESVPNLSGSYLAVRAGSCKVRARFDDFEATREIVIQLEKRSLIDLRPAVSPVVVRVGQTRSLGLLGLYSDQTEEPLADFTLEGGSPLYRIAGPSIIGLSHGTAQATAKFGSLEKRIDLYIQPPEIMSLRLTPSSFNLFLGENAIYSVEALYSDGTVENVTSEAAVRSSNAAILSVDKGRATIFADGRGAASLTVSYRGRETSALVAVDNPVISHLEIRPESLVVSAGRHATFQIIGVYTDDTEADLTNVVSPQVLSASRAEVTATGQLLGKTVGNTTLSAAYVDPVTRRNVSGTGSIMVSPAEVVALAFDNPAVNLALGRSYDFYVQGTYSDSTAVDVGGVVQIVADVSSPGMGYVAKIERTLSNRIRVRSVAEGKMRITAKLSGQTATTTITVGPKVLESIRIIRALQTDGQPPEFILRDNFADFSAIATFSDKTTLDVTQPVAGFTILWTEPDPTLAGFADSLDGKKRISALKEGTATFTIQVNSASQGQASASFNLGIYAPCPSPGQYQGQYCWFLGATGQSCQATCSALGFATHPATIMLGSDGGDCYGTINSLFRNSIKTYNGSASAAAGVGCAIYTDYGLNIGLRETVNATTQEASLPSFRRICSCE